MGQRPFGSICGRGRTDHLSSTFAPTFSRVALIFSASSLVAPSLTGFGAPSTRSLASFKPRPVTARTSLMTSIFLSPIAARTTVNSVCSSTGATAAPAPPAPGAATATAAAADTPHFSSSILASSAASRTVNVERSSTILARSAMVWFLYRFEQGLGTALRRFVSLGISPEHAGELGRRRVDDLSHLRGRRL